MVQLGSLLRVLHTVTRARTWRPTWIQIPTFEAQHFAVVISLISLQTDDGLLILYITSLKITLASIYLLEQRTSNSDPNVDLVSQRAACIALVANSYATGILNRE